MLKILRSCRLDCHPASELWLSTGDSGLPQSPAGFSQGDRESSGRPIWLRVGRLASSRLSSEAK